MDEWDALEKRCGFTVTVGSNPTLSASDAQLLAHALRQARPPAPQLYSRLKLNCARPALCGRCVWHLLQRRQPAHLSFFGTKIVLFSAACGGKRLWLGAHLCQKEQPRHEHRQQWQEIDADRCQACDRQRERTR